MSHHALYLASQENLPQDQRLDLATFIAHCVTEYILDVMDGDDLDMAAEYDIAGETRKAHIAMSSDDKIKYFSEDWPSRDGLIWHEVYGMHVNDGWIISHTTRKNQVCYDMIARELHFDHKKHDLFTIIENLPLVVIKKMMMPDDLFPFAAAEDSIVFWPADFPQSSPITIQRWSLLKRGVAIDAGVDRINLAVPTITDNAAALVHHMFDEIIPHIGELGPKEEIRARRFRTIMEKISAYDLTIYHKIISEIMSLPRKPHQD